MSHFLKSSHREGRPVVARNGRASPWWREDIRRIAEELAALRVAANYDERIEMDTLFVRDVLGASIEFDGLSTSAGDLISARMKIQDRQT